MLPPESSTVSDSQESQPNSTGPSADARSPPPRDRETSAADAKTGARGNPDKGGSKDSTSVAAVDSDGPVVREVEADIHPASPESARILRSRSAKRPAPPSSSESSPSPSKAEKNRMKKEKAKARRMREKELGH